LFLFFDINISQGSIVTRLTWVGFLWQHHYKFTAKSVGQRILKIGHQYWQS